MSCLLKQRSFSNTRPSCRSLTLSAQRADLLLSDACSSDVSPGLGYLSHSDDEMQPIENTIQLAWQPSFAEEYKRLMNTMEIDNSGLKAANQGKSRMHLYSLVVFGGGLGHSFACADVLSQA